MIKSQPCKILIISAMLYGSQTLCLIKNECEFLEMTKIATIISMFGVMLMDMIYQGFDEYVGIERALGQGKWITVQEICSCKGQSPYAMEGIEFVVEGTVERRQPKKA